MACDRIVMIFAPSHMARAGSHAAYFDMRRIDVNPVVPCVCADRACRTRAWGLYPAGAPYPCDCLLGARPRPYAR